MADAIPNISSKLNKNKILESNLNNTKIKFAISNDLIGDSVGIRYMNVHITNWPKPQLVIWIFVVWIYSLYEFYFHHIRCMNKQNLKPK